MKLFDDEDWDFEEDDSWELCKQILLEECNKMKGKNKDAKIMSGSNSYNMDQLYKEIENETELGVRMIEACIRLEKEYKNK